MSDFRVKGCNKGTIPWCFLSNRPPKKDTTSIGKMFRSCSKMMWWEEKWDTYFYIYVRGRNGGLDLEGETPQVNPLTTFQSGACLPARAPATRRQNICIELFKIICWIAAGLGNLTVSTNERPPNFHFLWPAHKFEKTATLEPNITFWRAIRSFYQKDNY